MKRLAVICCPLATPVFAQPQEEPERVVPETTISIGIGRAETLRFKSTFGVVNVATEGIVQAIPQSDRVLTLYGKAEGTTLLTVRTDRGDEIYSATVSVTQEPGRVVRLYGRRDVPDYTGFYCTDRACGRADKELNGSREPTRTIETIINR
jgi:hypothetical protein